MSPAIPVQPWRESFRRQSVLVIIDDLDATGSAIVVCSARGITPERLNETLTLSRGIPCVAIGPRRVQGLQLERMGRSRARYGDQEASRRMCVSVEAREGVTTGISVADRTATIRLLGNPTTQPRHLVQPGHIFPIEVSPGGVLVRPMLPEAAHDAVSITYGEDGALLLDLLSPDGAPCTHEQARTCAALHDYPVITLSELVRDRLLHEPLVEKVAEAKLPTALAGEMRAVMYRSTVFGGEHVALVKGPVARDRPVLIRVQPERTLSDVFGSEPLSSRNQLESAMKAIGDRGAGVIVYLRRPGRGALQEQVAQQKGGALAREIAPRHITTMREYGLGAQILRDLGVRQAELLTNTPRALIGLQTFGIEIVGEHPLIAGEVRGLRERSLN